MKNKINRIICFFVAFCICCTVLPQMVGVTADATEPKMSEKCETIIDDAGKNGSFGDAITDLRTSTSIKFSPSINLSNADVFEMDVYIENIEALNEVVSETQYIQFGFSSSSRRATLNHADANISEQLVANGWNHIEVKKADFIGANIDWEKIYYVYLKFADETQSLSNSLINKDVKTRNICESFDIPEINNIDILISQKPVFAKLGENEESLLSEMYKTFSVNIENADLSEVTIFKVDLFIPNFLEFNNFIADKNLTFILENGNKRATCIFDGAFFPTSVMGWYTIRMTVNDFSFEDGFDIKNIQGFRVGLNSNDDEKFNEYFDLSFGFANVRGEILAEVSDNVMYGEKVENYITDNKVFFSPASYSDFLISFEDDYPSLSDSDNVEFDLYVENYNSFINSFAYDAAGERIDASLNLVLSNGEGYFKWTHLEDMVLASGWNHIILPISKGLSDDFDVNRKFKYVYLEVAGTDNTNKNTDYGNILAFDNLCTTVGKANDNKLKFESVSFISDGLTYNVGATFDSINIKKNISPSVSLKEAKYIEFDIYIQNFHSFKQFIAENNISNMKFSLSSSDGDATDEILGLINTDGWNHIVLPLNSFENTGFDADNISAWSLIFEGNLSFETVNYNGQIISVQNIVATYAKEPEIIGNAGLILSKEGKTTEYGERYSTISETSLISFDEPIDLSFYGNIEFDFYVENYNNFKEIIKNSSEPLYFALATDESPNKKKALYEFTDQIVGEGWNHIVVDILDFVTRGGEAKAKIESVYHAYLLFYENSGKIAYPNETYSIKNICAVQAEYDILPTKPYSDIDISVNGCKTLWGKNYKSIVDLSTIDFEQPLDITDTEIQFDFYVEDYDVFKNMMAGSVDPLYICLNTNSNKYTQRALFAFDDQITHGGWNHVVIKLKNAVFRGGDSSADFKTLHRIYLTFWNSTGANPGSDNIMRIANIVANYADHTKLPALPDNVLAQLGVSESRTSAESTVGDYYHYTYDRIYCERLQSVDFSKSQVIEFDIYIDEYDEFLENNNSEANTRKQKLTLALSSTPPYLWEQYSAGVRRYFSAQIELEKYITHTGWNHVIVGKADFEPWTNTIDWSAINAFVIYYKNSSNYYPERTPNPNLYVKIANVVNTGVVANIPHNEDKALQVDKNAVYISSADVIADDNGTWNSSSLYVDKNYKTEGKASIHKELDYTDKIETGELSYLFDLTVDMSDLKTLKFDFFIDFPEFIQKSGNEFEIIIGQDRFLNDDYYSWNMELSTLKQGWNSLEFSLSNAKKVGNPDLTKAKIVMFRFADLNLAADKFESIVYGFDNLRYISSSGNKILKVEGWDENSKQSDEDYSLNTDNNDYSDVLFSGTNEKQTVEKIVNIIGKTKIIKSIDKITITDYLTSGIVIGVESVILVAASIIFLIVYKRRKKKKAL